MTIEILIAVFMWCGDPVGSEAPWTIKQCRAVIVDCLDDKISDVQSESQKTKVLRECLKLGPPGR